MSSHNFAVSTTKWYNLQGDSKICKNCQRKGIENQHDLIFSFHKYDNIRRVAYRSNFGKIARFL